VSDLLSQNSTANYDFDATTSRCFSTDIRHALGNASMPSQGDRSTGANRGQQDADDLDQSAARYPVRIEGVRVLRAS
jgi:hypothetical protein